MIPLLIVPTGEIPDNLFGWLLMLALAVVIIAAWKTLTRKGSE